MIPNNQKPQPVMDAVPFVSLSSIAECCFTIQFTLVVTMAKFWKNGIVVFRGDLPEEKSQISVWN